MRYESRRGKVLVVGDGGCGKTCLLEVFQQRRFPTEYVPTIIDNFISNVTVDGFNITLNIWDTAGEEEYDAVRGLSYTDTDVVLMCYQVGRPTSLENCAEKWVKEVRNYIPSAGIILVGCKADIRDMGRSQGECVKFDDGVRMKEKINADAFIETSARENKNVTETFDIAAKWIINNKNTTFPMKKWYYCYCC